MPGVIPFSLDDIAVSIPYHVGPSIVGPTEVPGALIANLVAARVIPGTQQRVGGGFHLFMGGDADRAIGIEIVVGTAVCPAGRQVRTHIRQ